MLQNKSDEFECRREDHIMNTGKYSEK